MAQQNQPKSFWYTLGDNIGSFGDRGVKTAKDTVSGGITGAILGGTASLGIGGMVAAAGAVLVTGVTIGPVLAAFGAAAACASLMALPNKMCKLLGGIAVAAVCIAAAATIGWMAAPFVAAGACIFGLSAGETVKMGAAGGGVISGIKSFLGFGKRDEPATTQECSQSQDQTINQNQSQQQTTPVEQTTAPAVETNTFVPIDNQQQTAAVAQSARASIADKTELAKYDLAVISKYMNDARVMGNKDSRAAIEAAYETAKTTATAAGMTEAEIKAIPAMETDQFIRLNAATLHDFADKFGMESVINITMSDTGKQMVAEHRKLIGHETVTQMIQERARDAVKGTTEIIANNSTPEISQAEKMAVAELTEKYGAKFESLEPAAKNYVIKEQVVANEMYSKTSGGKDQVEAQNIESRIAGIINNPPSKETTVNQASKVAAELTGHVSTSGDNINYTYTTTVPSNAKKTVSVA